MESIDEYMDKVMHYLKEVAEKDVLITEGIQKLNNCEHRIEKIRTDARDKQKEQKEQLEHQKAIARKKGFEVEQLAEQLKRITDAKTLKQNELRVLGAETNKKMLIEKVNFKKDMEMLENRRQVLADTFQRKVLNLSNQQAQ